MNKKEYIYIMWGKSPKHKIEYVDVGDSVIYPVWISIAEQDRRYITWLKDESPETILLKWKKWFAGYILYKNYVSPLCLEKKYEKLDEHEQEGHEQEGHEQDGHEQGLLNQEGNEQDMQMLRYPPLQSVDQIVLDAKVDKEIPKEIWNIEQAPSFFQKLAGITYKLHPTADFPEELHLDYACDMMDRALYGERKSEWDKTEWRIKEEPETESKTIEGDETEWRSTEMQNNRKTKQPVSLVAALPLEEQIGLQHKVLDFLEEKLIEHSETISELILIAYEDAVKERAEDLLEDIYDVTGLAGSCYLINEYKPYELFTTKRNRFLLDCIGLPMKSIYGITYYIDATGQRSHREIRKLESSGTACKTLRNYLDRAFLSKL